MSAIDFRDLNVWKEAMQLAELVYSCSRAFPADERFGLTSQVRRAAVSVASCIAEGNARRSTREYLHFLSIAAGSLAEVQTQLLLATRLGMMSDGEPQPVFDQVGVVSRLLQALRNSLSSRVEEDPTPFPVPRFPFPLS